MCGTLFLSTGRILQLPQQKPLPGLALVFHHIMSTRQPYHSDVSLHREQPTQLSLKVPQEAIQPGRKRSGTQLIQQSTKRSKENLRDEEAQASKIQSQRPHIEQQTDIEVDSEKGPEEVPDITMLLRELKVKRDNKTLGRRKNYVEKSIGCKVEGGETETVKDGLDTLEELSVLEGLCEGELFLDAIPVATDQERLNRVNEWVQQQVCGNITSHFT